MTRPNGNVGPGYEAKVKELNFVSETIFEDAQVVYSRDADTYGDECALTPGDDIGNIRNGQKVNFKYYIEDENGIVNHKVFEDLSEASNSAGFKTVSSRAFKGEDWLTLENGDGDSIFLQSFSTISDEKVVTYSITSDRCFTDSEE